MKQQDKDLQEIHSLILDMKAAAEQLSGISNDFPALNRNIKRILVSIKMLEINVADVFDNEPGPSH